jgi:uncharacterized protein YheU (UPF0270 family)
LDEPQEPVVIPYTELSPEALQGVVESFVLREGTEYGETDFSLEQKVAHVMRQLERKEAHVVFDPDSQSVNIVVNDQGKISRGGSMDKSKQRNIVG